MPKHHLHSSQHVVHAKRRDATCRCVPGPRGTQRDIEIQPLHGRSLPPYNQSAQAHLIRYYHNPVHNTPVSPRLVTHTWNAHPTANMQCSPTLVYYCTCMTCRALTLTNHPRSMRCHPPQALVSCPNRPLLQTKALQMLRSSIWLPWWDRCCWQRVQTICLPGNLSSPGWHWMRPMLSCPQPWQRLVCLTRASTSRLASHAL